MRHAMLDAVLRCLHQAQMLAICPNLPGTLDLASGIIYAYQMRRIVLDTNVVVAALRSRRRASNKLLSLVGSGRFDAVISVPLVLEYEDVLLRQLEHLPYTADEIREIIDYLCAACEPQAIYYLWRPILRDPKEDWSSRSPWPPDVIRSSRSTYEISRAPIASAYEFRRRPSS